MELLRQQEALHEEALAREMRLKEEVVSRQARHDLDMLRREHESQMREALEQQERALQAQYRDQVTLLKEESEKACEAEILEKTRAIQALSDAAQQVRIDVSREWTMMIMIMRMRILRMRKWILRILRRILQADVVESCIFEKRLLFRKIVIPNQGVKTFPCHVFMSGIGQEI